MYKGEMKEKYRRNKGEIKEFFKCQPLLFSTFLSASLFFIYFLHFFLPPSKRNSDIIYEQTGTDRNLQDQTGISAS